MKNNKLLVLPLLAFLTLGFLGCAREEIDPNDSSVSSDTYLPVTSVDVNALLTEAGNTLWDMYGAQNDEYVYSDFEVTRIINLRSSGASIKVSWELNVISGTKEGVSLQEVVGKKDVVQGVYVGFLDNVIKNEVTFELVPTLDFKGTKKTLSNILNGKVGFRRKIKVLNADNFDTYIAKCKLAGNNVGTSSETVSCVVGICQGISIDKKYAFIQDLENKHGYLAIVTNYEVLNFYSGCKVMLAGQVYAKDGVYAFYEPTVTLMERTPSSFVKAEHKDITSIVSSISSNNDSALDPYQNLRVEIKNVTLKENDGNKYYFTSNNVDLTFLYDTNYFFQESEKELIVRDFIPGFSANLKGTLIRKANEYVLIPDSDRAINVTSSEGKMMNYIKSHLGVAFEKEYKVDTLVDLPSSSYFNSTIEWTIEGEVDKNVLKVYSGQMHIIPSKLQENVASCKLIGTISVGNETSVVEYDIRCRKS